MAVDAFVNNAGFAQYGLFAEAEPDELVDMLQVNVVGADRADARARFLAWSNAAGRILNLGSVGSFAPAP